jgi:HlyD family secretion protein
MHRMRFLFVVVGLVGSVMLASCAGLPGAAPAATPTAVAVEPAGPVPVIADGKIVPLTDATLAFERGGIVMEVLIAEGEQVSAGQALARLDTRALALRVEEQRVNLQRAEARYQQTAEGASPEAIAAAEASIAQAQASQRQAVSNVSRQDIAAAQAQLDEARAALANLLDGPRNTEVTQAQAALDQANSNLTQTRDSLSAAKTNADLAVQQAANTLRNAQDEYSRIYWDNVELRDNLNGEDMPQERIDQEAAALRAVQNGEASLQQAQVAYDQARQAETEGVATAEARVRDAQARLEQLVAAPENDKISAARAQVAQAEANLARLRGDQRATQLEVAAASVAQAEANRNQVAAPPREVDLTAARVEIEAAKVALEQAELELDKATLYAPIAGTVAEVNLAVGEVVAASAPAIILADIGNWKVETDDLTELDVVRLREGDAVTLTFDALPELQLPGSISQIKPIGTNRQGDIVYTVVVIPDQLDPRLRWNMTTVVTVGG